MKTNVFFFKKKKYSAKPFSPLNLKVEIALLLLMQIIFFEHRFFLSDLL